MNQPQAHIDYALEYVTTHGNLIVQAHITLGIPLEDCLCGAVRRALRILEMNPGQLTLPGIDDEPTPPPAQDVSESAATSSASPEHTP